MDVFSKKIIRISKILFLGCLAFLFAQKVNAQDKIHKKSGKILHVKIIEVGVEDIRYRLQDQPDGIIYAVEKADVEKVVLENGLMQKFDEPTLDNPQIYADQHKNAVKVTFLAPLAGYTTFSYERALKPGRSWEAKLGIIGLGIRDPDKRMNLGTSYGQQSGAYVGAGYKFIIQPSYRTARQRYTHILNGAYFRPEISVGHYSENLGQQYYYNGTSFVWTDNATVSTTFGSITLSSGRQWVFDDTFLIDMFLGLGYGTMSKSSSGVSAERYNNSGASYGTYVGTGGFAFLFGLNIGFLFK